MGGKGIKKREVRAQKVARTLRKAAKTSEGRLREGS